MVNIKYYIFAPKHLVFLINHVLFYWLRKKEFMYNSCFKVYLNKFLSKVFAFVLFVFPFIVNAQSNPPPPPGDNVNDEFPIDSPVLFVAMLACLFAYFIFKRYSLDGVHGTRLPK